MVLKYRRIWFNAETISSKFPSEFHVVVRYRSHRADDVGPRRERLLSHPVLTRRKHAVEIAFPKSMEGAGFSRIRHVLDLAGRHDLAAQVGICPFGLSQ